MVGLTKLSHGEGEGARFLGLGFFGLVNLECSVVFPAAVVVDGDVDGSDVGEGLDDEGDKVGREDVVHAHIGDVSGDIGLEGGDNKGNDDVVTVGEDEVEEVDSDEGPAAPEAHHKAEQEGEEVRKNGPCDDGREGGHEGEFVAKL